MNMDAHPLTSPTNLNIKLIGFGIKSGKWSLLAQGDFHILTCWRCQIHEYVFPGATSFLCKKKLASGGVLTNYRAAPGIHINNNFAFW